MSDKLPDNFTRIGREESFRFACHPGIACFTECCRELDLALTPYDVLRLRKRLSMDSAAFMERYVIIEQNPDLILPQCYLTMVDDGSASCVFVSRPGVRFTRIGRAPAAPILWGVGQRFPLTARYRKPLFWSEKSIAGVLRNPRFTTPTNISATRGFTTTTVLMMRCWPSGSIQP